MDFHSLSRRELQALCKRNKIPANVTNVAMADSLKALAIVEGVDEVLQDCKSEISQASIEPPTGGRSTRQKDVLLTPAQSGVTSRRRRAVKEDSTVKQAYGTRRSARLAEKSAKSLKGVTDFSKKDLFTGDGQEFKMNLEESVDGSDELSGVTGTEDSVSKDEGQVDSGDKQAVSTDVEQASVVEEELIHHTENDGSKSRLKEGVDANTSMEVNFEKKDEPKAEEVKLVPDIEEEHYSTVGNAKIELNESRGAEQEVKLVPDIEEEHDSTADNAKIELNESRGAGFFEQVGSETDEFGKCNDKKASNDETLALALNLNGEALKADGLHAIETSENQITRIDTQKIEEKTAEDAEGDFVIAEVSFDTFIHIDDEELSDADSNPHEVVVSHENGENLELNTDSSEPESNPDESDSDNFDFADESLACMSYEISLMSKEDIDASNWDVTETEKQDVAIDVPLLTSLENSPTHQLAAVAPINIMENEANQQTFSTPKRASASKASSRMIRLAAVTDNKENIGGGSKTAPAKERSKIVKDIAEAVLTLDGPSLLSKNFKDLTITQNLDKIEGENGAYARAPLQARPDNQKAN